MVVYRLQGKMKTNCTERKTKRHFGHHSSGAKFHWIVKLFLLNRTFFNLDSFQMWSTSKNLRTGASLWHMLIDGILLRVFRFKYQNLTIRCHCRYVIKERYEEFTNSQRSQIVWQILTRARYDNNAKEKVLLIW